MHFQNSDTPLQIRPVHDDAPVETARAQKCLVQDLRPVGRAQDQDSLGRLETVHFGEQLVQGLFSLLVSAAVLGVAAAADGVDLIDENNAGRVLVRFLEKVADTGSAYTNVQFNKVGTGQREEGDVRLSCYSLCKQSLAGAGRAHKKGSLGELCSDLHILAGIMQEVDHFLKGLLGLVLACDIRECDPGVLLHIFLGRALSDAAHKAASSGSAEYEAHDDPQEYDRQYI